VLIQGKVNNVTTSKIVSGNSAVFLADSKSVMFTFDVAAPLVNSASLLSLNSNNSSTSSTSSTPTANDLALEDPNTVNSSPFGSLGIGV
jgi:hypothetical protein